MVRAQPKKSEKPLLTLGSQCLPFGRSGGRSAPNENLNTRQTIGGNTMKIRPLHDRVLVSRVEEAQVSSGGIIIPDSAKEKPIRGRIVAVGNGKITKSGDVRPLTVKAGDEVLYSKYAGTEVKLGGEEHLIMREDDILGVIE